MSMIVTQKRVISIPDAKAVQEEKRRKERKKEHKPPAPVSVLGDGMRQVSSDLGKKTLGKDYLAGLF